MVDAEMEDIPVTNQETKRVLLQTTFTLCNQGYHPGVPGTLPLNRNYFSHNFNCPLKEHDYTSV